MTTQSPDLLVDLRERMVRIETKLDVHAETATNARKDIDDHERRLSALEAAYKVLAAVGAILLFIVTFFQAKITALIG